MDPTQPGGRPQLPAQLPERLGNYRIEERLDVFLLAVLVALVKLSTWAKILPGPGLFAFTAVVVLTMLASAAFDPKLIWQRP